MEIWTKITRKHYFTVMRKAKITILVIVDLIAQPLIIYIHDHPQIDSFDCAAASSTISGKNKKIHKANET
jgi:hypothetical protein